ncbi:MAG TPA: phosphatidylglycerophosphatase A [Pyrinomonadaceae bacterium]|nr:phosphatidylglycerophosphatase A [Pyrinomonadaceae bacterium]
MKSMKETSDELNPHIAPAGVAVAPGRLNFKDYLALIFSTWGVGLIPFAPGTWGSLVGVGLYLLLRFLLLRAIISLPHFSASQTQTLNTTVNLCAAFAVSFLGVWAATRAEKFFRRKDPGAVVVDEVAGQLVTFLVIPLSRDLNIWIIAAGFLLFRAFDIWKPYPARRLESLESGLGIMADDIVAGAYSAAVLSVIILIQSFI